MWTWADTTNKGDYVEVPGSTEEVPALCWGKNKMKTKPKQNKKRVWMRLSR